MTQRPIHIEHPDLTQMAEKELWNECIYWHDYAQKILTELGHSLLALGRGDGVPIPIRKRSMDFYFASERYEAILEEIDFRNASMR